MNKTKYLFSIILLYICTVVWGNNIQVTNVRLTSQNTSSDFTMVEFDISWENSWRYSGGPANWDAAWIFVKYRIGVAGAWQHAFLNNTGHVSAASTTITSGFLSPALPFNATTNPAMGVYLYRSAAGTGTFTSTDVQLRWNYGANNIVDGEEVDVQVFAIEMVYIPQGNFYVGSGGTESGAFYAYPTTTTPYQITSENAIPVGTSTGNLYYANTSGTSGDQQGPIPAAYPKGFAAFYVMKYELSQKGYVEFLNSLTRAQQINRVRSNISGTNSSAIYIMSDYYEPVARNGIRCLGGIPPAPAVVFIFCDYNMSNIPDESSDGLSIPSNHMTQGDINAYMDWACLRPMTEFEFEKCARGPKTPLSNEYAWGTNVLYKNNNLDFPGQPNERPSEYYSNSPFEQGPTRNGAFARSNSTRELAGAGYYGCMDLSGNILEIGVSAGHPTGRAYTGAHGNGILTAGGDGDVANWPTTTGVFTRGGSYITTEILQERISDRTKANTVVTYYPDTGVRAVRTAQ